MRGWKAWYTDGRTFDSAGTAWADLPPTGVLGAVVYLDPPYRELVSGGDWYWLDADGRPTTGDTTWDGWVDPPDVPEAELKRGAAVPDAAMARVEERMMGATEWR